LWVPRLYYGGSIVFRAEAVQLFSVNCEGEFKELFCMRLAQKRTLAALIVILSLVLALLFWSGVFQSGEPTLPKTGRGVEAASSHRTVGSFKSRATNVQYASEAITDSELQIIRERKDAILKNYQFLELRRTVTLQYASDADGSTLAVLINPPTDGEMNAAMKFAQQYFNGLGPAATNELKDLISGLHRDFNFRGESRYVSMFISPADATGGTRFSIKTGTVPDGSRFMEDFKRGTIKLGNTRTQSGPEPHKDWRYAHIFQIKDGLETAALPGQ
jgi:hypothetical protein